MTYLYVCWVSCVCVCVYPKYVLKQGQYDIFAVIYMCIPEWYCLLKGDPLCGNQDTDEGSLSLHCLVRLKQFRLAPFHIASFHLAEDRYTFKLENCNLVALDVSVCVWVIPETEHYQSCPLCEWASLCYTVGIKLMKVEILKSKGKVP